MSELEQFGEPEKPELADGGNWRLTERLLETLNGELGSLKEYVLTELRGEITSLRSEKLQLQSQVQELRHEQDILLSERQHAQQQEWAQQFAQVLAQNLQQEIQSQAQGLADVDGYPLEASVTGGEGDPERRLSLLHQNMASLQASLEASLADAIGSVQRELGLHQSELSQQLLRMQDLEQQGEALLAALVAKLSQGQAGASVPTAAPELFGAGGVSQPLRESQPVEAIPSSKEPRVGGPADVASVMAAMPSLKPPAPASEALPRLEGEGGITNTLPPDGAKDGAITDRSSPDTTRAAAIAMPPRLTVAQETSTAGTEARDVAVPPMVGGDTTDDGDEAFIADFPIGAVKPGANPESNSGSRSANPVPLASANSASSLMPESGPSQPPSSQPRAKSSSVLADMPELAAPGRPSKSSIVNPPGMEDRWQAAGEEAEAEELYGEFPSAAISASGPVSSEPASSGPVSPWQAEPPTTITSLTDLTMLPGARAMDMSVADVAGASRQSQNPVLQNPTLEDSEFQSLDAGTAPAKPVSPSISTSSALPSWAEKTAAATLLQPGEVSRSTQVGQQRRSGALIAVLALFCTVLQYVILQVLFHGGPGLAVEQGLIAATWGSALVTFWIRMLMVLPFMIVIGQGLYPPLIQEMQGVFRDRDPIPLISITASGLFFFLAHFLLYGAIATSSATPAVALFLIYPAVGLLLGWGLFNQPLNQARLLATACLAFGILLLLGLWGDAGGRMAALSSGLCFSLYLMLTAVNGRRMNPITLTVLQLGLAWLCSMPALFVLPQAAPLNDIGYVLTCMVLSLMMVLNQLLGLASRRRAGAGLTAALQGLLPLLVGLLGLFLTHELLAPGQILAVLFVSGGAVALGWERMSRERLR